MSERVHPEPVHAELVHYGVDRGIATVTLDSPSKRNALSAQLVGELAEHLETAAADGSVRAVVLTHTGRVFCSGADLDDATPGGGPADSMRRMLAVLRTVLSMAKPVIARVDGPARAGGLGLIGACDIVLASQSANFCFTEVRLGLAPAIISLTTLPGMTSRAVSRYYLTGETFDAAAAEAAGLVTVATDDLDTELETLLAALRRCSPQGLAETKALTSRAGLAALDAGADEMRELSARLFASEEAHEGMTSFLQKRPPRWAPDAP
ncbi:MAG: enoyl-CoA hydratase family protein [Actinomycetota bacterium]|nr:enoyl-CoA hydratase family protein [Actinomycetota bacterium]